MRKGKRAHSQLGILNRHQHRECNGVQRNNNTSYMWSCYHTVTNLTIYICGGITATAYLIYKFRISKTGSTSEDTRSSSRQRPINQKGNKSEWQ